MLKHYMVTNYFCKEIWLPAVSSWNQNIYQLFFRPESLNHSENVQDHIENSLEEFIH